MKHLFLIGAGFNIDANRLSGWEPEYFYPGNEVGMTHDDSSMAWEQKEFPLHYPLVEDIRNICFGPDIQRALSVEDLFSDAYKIHDHFVLNRLSTVIRGADYYIASKITSDLRNPYNVFIQKFEDSHFISFNYDALLELFLYRQKKWSPEDGFGVDAEVEKKSLLKPEDKTCKSNTIVVHPHGSLYLYPVESNISEPDSTNTQWLTMRDTPRFIFDPDCNQSLFKHYCRPDDMHGYQHPYYRFIPPINDKSGSLEDHYYKIIMEKVLDLVVDSEILIAIGYSFAESDTCSYEDILRNLFRDGKRLVIISPEAEEITERLRIRYIRLSPDIVSIPLTFAQWAERGFPLGA